jgi:hypothetical protein
MAHYVTMGHWAGFMLKLGKEYVPTVKRGIKSGCMRSIRILQMATMRAPSGAYGAAGQGIYGAVNTGQYKRAWKFQELSDGGKLFNDTPYAPIIEYGRRPGKGISQIGQIAVANWARRRLGVDYAQAKGIAFCISRKYKRVGLKGRYVLRDSLPEIENAINAGVKEAVDKTLQRLDKE